MKNIPFIIILCNVFFSSAFSYAAEANLLIELDFRDPDLVFEYQHENRPDLGLNGWIVIKNSISMPDEEISKIINEKKPVSRSVFIIKKNDVGNISMINLKVENNKVVIPGKEGVEFLIDRQTFCHFLFNEIEINWEKWVAIRLLKR